jgi:hypothetical protein
LLHADLLSRKDLAEIDLAPLETAAPQRVTTAFRGEKPRSSRRSNGFDERATVHRLSSAR